MLHQSHCCWPYLVGQARAGLRVDDELPPISQGVRIRPFCRADRAKGAVFDCYVAVTSRQATPSLQVAITAQHGF